MSEFMTLEELLPRMRCPRGGGALRRAGDALVSEAGDRYPIDDGGVDLRCPPARLRFDLPWFEPWEALEKLSFEKPAPIAVPDLPYHLDAHLAAIPGQRGEGRWLLEVGCGERRCEAYFISRGFRYVGGDADRRGRGRQVLLDAHNLPFVDGAFDLYLSLAVYEHLACPLQAALEGFRVLKPGGTFFGTAAFVYGFHDRASFHHMTHAGLLWTLRSAGLDLERVWSDWRYTKSIPEMAFGPGKQGLPWRVATTAFLRGMDWSFLRVSNAMRRLAGKPLIDLAKREVANAASLSFVARRGASPR